MPKHCGNTTMYMCNNCKCYICPKCEPYHKVYCK